MVSLANKQWVNISGGVWEGEWGGTEGHIKLVSYYSKKKILGILRIQKLYVLNDYTPHEYSLPLLFTP